MTLLFRYSPQSGLDWIAGRICGPDGYVVVFDAEVHFDESGTHASATVVGLAGYIILKDQYAALERDWDAVLNWDALPHKLPYFHMADCAPDPGNGVFAGISKPLRIQIVSRLIAAIKRHTAMGFAVTVDIDQFNTFVGIGHPLYPDPYVLLMQTALV